jgi:hypothetical protein
MEIMPKICLNDGGWYTSYESYSSSYNGYYFRNGEENYWRYQAGYIADLVATMMIQQKISLL